MLATHLIVMNYFTHSILLPLSYWHSIKSKVLIFGFPIAVIAQARSGSLESETMLGIGDDTEERSQFQ